MGIDVSDIKEMCRLCLAKSPGLCSLFALPQPENESNIPLYCKIMTCSSVSIAEGDKLPQGVCKACLLLVEQSYNHRILIEKSDAKLRALLEFSQHTDNDSSESEQFDSWEADFVECELNMEEPTTGTNDRESLKDKNDPEDKATASESDEDTPLLVVKRKKINIGAKDRVKKKPELEGKIIKRRGKRRPCPHKELVRSKMPDYGNLMPDGVSYFCNQCKKLLKCYRNFYEHVKFIHLNIRDYLCPHCGYQAQNNFLLSQHIDSQHFREDKYPCLKCPKKFCTKQNLRIHQYSTHGPEKKERTHVCETCGKAFYKWYILKRHLSTHSDRSLHKCDHCDRTFILLHSLRRHVKRHTGDKPHKCSYCPAAYWQSTDRKNHEARIHKDEVARMGRATEQSIEITREHEEKSKTPESKSHAVVGVNSGSHDLIQAKLGEKPVIRVNKAPSGFSEFHRFLE